MARVSRKRQALPAPAVDAPIRRWKAALYVRLSVEDNGKDSDSIENQIALLERYVAAHTYLEKTAVFVDNGYTGTDFHRPEFNRMMEAVKQGIVDCIVVKDLSRLGRNYIETAQFIEKVCPLFHLRFLSVNDGFDTETATSEGRLSASLSNIINDFYAKDISRKVTTALQAKMERGDYIGNYAPYGYRKDPENRNHLLIDPETAPTVVQIFRWRAEGLSYMGINKKLNDAGVPSPSQRRQGRSVETDRAKKDRRILWNKHMVTELLQNVVYIGHLAQRKGRQCLSSGIPYHRTAEEEWVIVHNTHEPLLSEALFARVQEVNRAALERTKANWGKYDHLPKEKNIYGKKFLCADCGAVMKLHRSFSRKKDKAYFTFKCPTYAEHGARACSDVKIRKQDLDAAVLSLIQAQIALFLDREKTLRALLAKKEEGVQRDDPAKKIRALRQKLAQKQSLLSGMYVDCKEGLLSDAEYSHHKELVLEDIRALEQRLSALTAEPLSGEMRWTQMIRRFQDAAELSEELVNAFLSSMKLHADGALEIKLRCADELAALTKACEKLRKESA